VKREFETLFFLLSILQNLKLGSQVISLADESGELSGLVETRSEQTGDLTNDGLGSKKAVVLGSEFLHFLLVLLQGLHVLDREKGHSDLNARSNSTIKHWKQIKTLAALSQSIWFPKTQMVRLRLHSLGRAMEPAKRLSLEGS
jgi:hypothetical protein